MAAMMACRTAPMPLTMAIRQAPMVCRMDSSCLVLLVGRGRGGGRWGQGDRGGGERGNGEGLTHETTAPIVSVVCASASRDEGLESGSRAWVGVGVGVGFGCGCGCGCGCGGRGDFGAVEA